MNQLPPAAASLRADLLRAADIDKAVAIASAVSNACIDRFNSEPINTATHLVASMLTARALIQVAAEWGAHDLALAPMPISYAAVLSIVTDLPAEIDGRTYDTRTEGDPR